MRRQRIFEVTGKQIWMTLVIGAIALTVVFEIGVFVGKRRVINAELEMARLSLPTNTGLLDAEGPTSESSPRQTYTGSSPKRQNGVRAQSDKSSANEKLPLDRLQKRTRYTVKVGTFNSRENAEKLISSLTSSGYKPWLRSEVYGGRKFYHVLVGEFGDMGEAKRFGDLLQKKLSYIRGYMIKEITKTGEAGER